MAEDLDEQTRGMAMVGQLLSFQLIGILKAKGILSKAETVGIYDSTLSQLEALPPDFPGIGEARKILDQMLGIASKSPPNRQ